MIENLKKDARRWCQGKNAWIRLPFLFWFAYVLVRHLQDPHYQSILGALNLGIHEFGHLVFHYAGEFLGFMGGTLMQLIAPVYGVFNFYKQRDYFSIALCFGWLSTNFFDIATYAGDARSQALNLVTPFGGHPKHDWHFMLSKINLLNFDQAIALGFRFFGVISMLACFVCGGWILYQMIIGLENEH